MPSLCRGSAGGCRRSAGHLAAAHPVSYPVASDDVRSQLGRGGAPARAASPPQQHAGSLSYRAITRRNLLTLFNLILAACAVALIATGQLADLLFAAVLVVNSGIGIVQEVRAKRALDRLALLAAPRARVLRDGARARRPVDDVVAGDAIVAAARAIRSSPTAGCSRPADCRSTSRS